MTNKADEMPDVIYLEEDDGKYHIHEAGSDVALNPACQKYITKYIRATEQPAPVDGLDEALGKFPLDVLTGEQMGWFLKIYEAAKLYRQGHAKAVGDVSGAIDLLKLTKKWLLDHGTKEAAAFRIDSAIAMLKSAPQDGDNNGGESGQTR